VFTYLSKNEGKLLINIILCGGNGTRLWPLSRSLLPKQFVKLFHQNSLFQLTVKRNASLCERRIVVSNQEQYFLALDQLEEIADERENEYILEPVGKNTAPAIALSCFGLDEDEIVLVTPSDHLIKNEEEYLRVLRQAKSLAEQDFLVTFGIEAKFAETGYGYIEADGDDVKAFHEKPDAQRAKEYLRQGCFYWNSGMFCFKAGLFLSELKKYAPKIYETAQKAFQNRVTQNNTTHKIRFEDMQSIPEESIDYAVMEKSTKVKMVKSDIDWSDLGSFDALSEEFEKDENGNTKRENLLTLHAKNNFVHTSSRMISLVDVQDLIVVDTVDALLITKRGNSEKIKTIVKELNVQESELPHTHVTTHRPWGTYTVLEQADGYKIKTIVVKPGKRLSLQKHLHRSEHWIVLSGIATVTVGKKVEEVRANESTYIKMGEIHRLENRGKVDVVIIEAQVGEYTGEDDIIRIEDDYKRV